MARHQTMTIVTDQTAPVHGRFVTSMPAALRDPGSAAAMASARHVSVRSSEAAVNTRDSAIFWSPSILLMLGASMTLLVLSARRAQEVARQQMEFVAGVPRAQDAARRHPVRRTTSRRRGRRRRSDQDVR